VASLENNNESKSEKIDDGFDWLRKRKKEMDEEVIKSFEKKIEFFIDKRHLAEQFLELQPLFYDKSKNWWLWDKDNYKWILVDETDILNSINNKAKVNTISSRDKNEIIEALKQEGRKKIPKDLPKIWLQFKNVMVDIKSGKTFEARSEYFVTNPIPHEIGDEEDTPTMDRVFEEWVGKGYVLTLYEIIAYCMLPGYTINRLFCFIGGGMNGKTKFLELISRFIGQDNITTTELDVLLDSRFEITRLHKKLVCLMGETNFNEMKKTSILKKLTGGDLIGFEYKNKDPFQDYNYAKILISTNNLPATTDKTLGFYRRWLIIDFPNRFTEKKDILEDIPQEEYNNLAKKCIRILKELLIKREFTNDGTVEDRMKKFEEMSDPLGKFIKEMINEDCDRHIFKFEFKNRFNDWCVENNFRKISENAIGRKMKELGHETARVATSWYSEEGEKKRYMAWVGVDWQGCQGCQGKSNQYTHMEISSNSHDNLDNLDIINEEVVK